jgi:hypothetical protein
MTSPPKDPLDFPSQENIAGSANNGEAFFSLRLNGWWFLPSLYLMVDPFFRYIIQAPTSPIKTWTEALIAVLIIVYAFLLIRKSTLLS